MHIHVFVLNRKIGACSLNLNLQSSLYFNWKSFAPIIIAIAENHNKEMTVNWKKIHNIKAQKTNNQIHKKLTTSMKQLIKILIKNFLSIVKITDNIKMPLPITLESYDCTS